MKLTPEQVDAVNVVIKDNAAVIPDSKLVNLIKDQVRVDVKKYLVTKMRKSLGLNKTRGRKSHIVTDVVSTESPVNLEAPV